MEEHHKRTQKATKRSAKVLQKERHDEESATARLMLDKELQEQLKLQQMAQMLPQPAWVSEELKECIIRIRVLKNTIDSVYPVGHFRMLRCKECQKSYRSKGSICPGCSRAFSEFMDAPVIPNIKTIPEEEGEYTEETCPESHEQL